MDPTVARATDARVCGVVVADLSNCLSELIAHTVSGHRIDSDKEPKKKFGAVFDQSGS